MSQIVSAPFEAATCPACNHPTSHSPCWQCGQRRQQVGPGESAQEVDTELRGESRQGRRRSYPINPSQFFGPRWKNRRPPGLPAHARRASILGAAQLAVVRLAGRLRPEKEFARVVAHLAQTESGATFALPANIFNTLPPGQRGGAPYISAWGVFQFNRDAWRNLPGVAASAFPWDCTPREEIQRPLEKFASLFHQVLSAGGNTLDAARGVRLWHRTPTGFNSFLAKGRRVGFRQAWLEVAADHRLRVDNYLRQAGFRIDRVAPSPGPTPPQPSPGPTPAPGPTPQIGPACPPGFRPADEFAVLRQRIVNVALQEWHRWNRPRIRRETDPVMSPVLQEYFRLGSNTSFPAERFTDPTFQRTYPWSAAFVGYVVRRAGAGSRFRYSTYHSDYAYGAKQNRLSGNNQGPQLFRVTEVALRPGDIIVKRRGNNLSFDNVAPQMQGHGDIVVSIQGSKAILVGGNIDQTVSQIVKPLAADGKLLNSEEYFGVVRFGGLNTSNVCLPENTPNSQPNPPTAPRSSSPAAQPVAPRSPDASQRATPIPRSVNAGAAPESQTAANGNTIVAPIDLSIRTRNGGTVKKQTVIYCPPGFNSHGGVDVIVYLHGIFTTPGMDVVRYLDKRTRPQSALRDELANSRRNAVLVVPLLSPNSQSEIGILARDGGLDTLVRAVMDLLRRSGQVAANSRVRNVIIACHSGGGQGMRLIAGARNQLADRVREYWGFDCLYGKRIQPDDATWWRQWSLANPTKRLAVFYQSTTADQSRKLQRFGLTNVSVRSSNAPSHDWVPKQHFIQLLTASTNLRRVK